MSFFKSKSPHAPPNPESEKDVKIDLNSLDHIAKWSDEQRKSLLFTATCLLPTAHIRALLDYRHKLKHDQLTSNSGNPLDVLTAAIDADSESVLAAALSWEKQYIVGLAEALKLTPNHSNACFPLLGRHADSTPFIEALPVRTLTERVTIMLVLLHDSLLICGGYDARVRAMLRLLSAKLKVRWEFFCSMENRYASALQAEINKHKAKNEESDKSKAVRWLKIGSAAVVGGVLIGLSAGLLAAPLLGAGLAGIGLTSAGASVGALVASTSGIVLVSTIFGSVGAGLTGYKMNRRVGVLEEFQFVPLLSKQAKAAQSKSSKSKEPKKTERGLAVVVGVNGFLRKDQSGYETVWNGLINSPGLAQSSEIDILHWESEYLIELGASLHSISASALVKSWTVGQIKKLMIGSLLAAISWPLQIVKVTNVIDASYSVVLERSEKAAIELANVIESRQAGYRPITLIGFSTGARMIFLALEELARRRDERLKAAAIKLQNAAAATSVDESAARDISLAPVDNKLQETDEKMAPTRATINENGEQKVLTAKGYESLPKDSILLNADPVFDVFLFGTPVQCNFDRFLRVRSMIAGRFVNGYSNNDWLLTFVHSVNSASLNTAGLRPVTRAVSDAVEQAEKAETSRPKQDATPDESDEQEKVHAAAVTLDSAKLAVSGDVDGVGIENVNLSDLVDGHIEYPEKIMDALKLAKFQP